MPDLKIYTPTDPLPAEYECQIRAYIRLLWHDHYEYDLDEPLVLPERHPHFVILAERHALLSAARVIWMHVDHAGQQFKLYCLGDVFTYPDFRQRGYGSQIVAAATELIRRDAQADAAILYTEPNLEHFYGQHGWEHIAGLTSTNGFPESPEPHPGFAMMLFLSPQAQAARADFAEKPIFLPGYGW